ncbi:phage tail protein I [Candidatus Vondammii sp. HM_W22]|uniref:phage tail protein I n=1 Tax=Candidatus Vondammii sp. HM_W22 TaxID=2687299 RepID=UPI001F133F9C|nr:phage tail protein I [Candidatus Vondammii sp. HM_W22]
MTDTLMPPSSSPLEKVADLTAALHIEAIPVERIFDQWHPQRCPAGLLGCLAWAVSVDDWNPDCPEQVKRDVIESSVQVHRHKGTLYSVKQALSSLAIQTQISEWTENTQTNTPYSFIVSAFVN